MIDANALDKNIADKFRTLINTEAQDKYYAMLLDTLETNINTLRRDGLDSKTAVTATIKEMGDETKANQEIADKINSCENNQTCVDNEIKKVSDELIITEEEISKIKAEQNNESSYFNENNNSSPLKRKEFILPNGIMQDNLKEKISTTYNGEYIVPSFIDLSKMNVEITDTNIQVQIEMLKIPNVIILDEKNMAYRWEILFDINNDSKLSNGDIKFMIDICYCENNKTKYGSIVDIATSIGVGAIFNVSKTSYAYSNINVQEFILISNNKIIFNLPKDIKIDGFIKELKGKSLYDITPLTRVYFYTYYWNGIDGYSDCYPHNEPCEYFP